MMKRVLIPATLVFAAATAWAADGELDTTPPPKGSVSKADGLAAWGRIYEVASHPRCANCHTGVSDVPMWSGPSYGKKPRPHGMNIHAGASRLGAETVPCATCHVAADKELLVDAGPHMAPRVAATWRLAPPEAHWFGRTSQQICVQLRDPKLNGNRTYQDLAGHLGHDVILHWAWSPGGGREPAPYDLQKHVKDILTWGVAGMPCPED